MDTMPDTIALRPAGAAIHPTAVVARAAELGAGVRIGPYCTVGPEVVIEDGAELVSHVVVDGHTRIGPDVVLEVVRLCGELTHQHPHLVFFAGKLIFSDEVEGYLGRFLHLHTTLEVQRYLQIEGLSLVILPVRVTPSEPRPVPATRLSEPRPTLP